MVLNNQSVELFPRTKDQGLEAAVTFTFSKLEDDELEIFPSRESVKEYALQNQIIRGLLKKYNPSKYTDIVCELYCLVRTRLGK